MAPKVCKSLPSSTSQKAWSLSLSSYMYSLTSNSINSTYKKTSYFCTKWALKNHWCFAHSDFYLPPQPLCTCLCYNDLSLISQISCFCLFQVLCRCCSIHALLTFLFSWEPFSSPQIFQNYTSSRIVYHNILWFLFITSIIPHII